MIFCASLTAINVARTGNAYQQKIDAVVRQAEAAVASLPSVPAFDHQPILDQLQREEAREPLVPLGKVFSSARLGMTVRGATPRVRGAAFAAPATPGEEKEIQAQRKNVAGDTPSWFVVVPQRKKVSGLLDEHETFDASFAPVIADAGNSGELESQRQKGLLWERSLFQFPRSTSVVQLEPVTAVKSGNQYYTQDLGAYAAAPKEFKKLSDNGGSLLNEGSFFERSDGKIIPRDRLDFAVATYPNFYKKLALLGGETAVYSIMYSLFRKARLNYMVKRLTELAPHIVGGSITLKALEGKLRFMPFNPFHTRALPYLAAYMMISEAAAWLRRKIPDVSYVQVALKKAYRMLESSDIDADVSFEYATGMPIQLYPIIEFLTTGRIGTLEKLGEAGSLATLGYMGINSSWKKTAVDAIRRFLIVYVSLQMIDKDATKKLMKVAYKDKKELFGLLQAVVDKKDPDAPKKLFEYVEKETALRQRSFLSSILNHGKAKPVAQKLIDAQILFRYRLKAAFWVNTVWSLPLLMKAAVGLIKRINN
jgi:hypothetical protein